MGCWYEALMFLVDLSIITSDLVLIMGSVGIEL